MGRRKRGADGYEAVCALGVTLHYVPLTLTFLAFLHLTLFSREFSLSQNLKNEKQPTSTGSVSMGEQSHSQGVFHTEEGDVSYWAHCVSILRVLGKGKLSREEGKVWEGEKGERTGMRQCARSE